MARGTKQTATMWQVAERAGVSQATVSNVFNDVGGNRVTEATRERVLKAVQDLDYSTNAFAKSLRSGNSGMIGFISDEVASAPFAGGLLKGAQLLAWETGNVILNVDTFRDPELEQAAIDMMLSYRVRGVIYASMYHRVVDLPVGLASIPTVVVNAEERTGLTSSVFPDEELGGFTATQHLLEVGHTRIAMIDIQGADSDLPAGVGRLAGYRRALTGVGITVDEDLVRYGSGVVEDGFSATLDLMRTHQPPTAIFCGNDRTAWGSYRALGTLGLRAPDDCSIIGFDNHDMIAPNLDPGLTTLELPYEQMAHKALTLLLSPSPTGPIQIPMQCPLILRGSVATPKEVPA